MLESSAGTILPSEDAAKLVDFARTCKAAARAVSLYPAGHPAGTTSLARLAESASRLTERGRFALQVHANELVVDGARMPKADPSLGDLANLLHRHLIAGLTLNPGIDAQSWRTLLLLLSRAPEEVRADGGIAHLWGTAGGPSIEIHEIDYTEVLREKQGLAASIDQILAAALAGPNAALDDASVESLLEIVSDADKLRMLVEKLQATAAASPGGIDAQAHAFLTLARGLAEYVGRTSPETLGTVFEHLGRGARHLSVDAMISLLSERSRPGSIAGSINVVDALADHMSDSSVAGFVADGVVAERGATERLAHAFQALVPEYDRQRQLLALVKDEVAASELGAGDGFAELWQSVEGMLTSYTDAGYVSEDYGRELSHARTQPLGVEQTSDDPPERIAAWLATVSDGALRDLDRDLLADLLNIESDPPRWRDVTETVVGHADDLIRVGHFDQALHLLEQVIEQGERDSERQPHVGASLERLGKGSLPKHLSAFLRGADEPVVARLTRICHRVGTVLVAPFAEALASEQDARSRRRLRDILVGFGPRGAESVRPLMNAGNWEVRRTAAYLLREFGGAEGLKELVPLLADTEPLVQREAVQGLVLNGSDEAGAILLRALVSASGRSKETLLAEVLDTQAERATRFFAYVLRNLEPSRLPALYVAATEALGASEAPEAVDALKTALHRGTWWAPFANKRYRGAAAQSLRRIGTPGALAALREASERGAIGVRAAARAELARIEER